MEEEKRGFPFNLPRASDELRKRNINDADLIGGKALEQQYEEQDRQKAISLLEVADKETNFSQAKANFDIIYEYKLQGETYVEAARDLIENIKEFGGVLLGSRSARQVFRYLRTILREEDVERPIETQSVKLFKRLLKRSKDPLDAWTNFQTINSYKMESSQKAGEEFLDLLAEGKGSKYARNTFRDKYRVRFYRKAKDITKKMED